MKDLIKAAKAHAKETHRMTVDLFYQHGIPVNSNEVMRELLNGVEYAYAYSFMLGANWQKKQSPWISVKEELPETSPVYGNASPYVLVFLKEYGFDAIGYYRADGEWVAEFTKDGIHGERPVEVDFWMPIPPTPKGGEND